VVLQSKDVGISSVEDVENDEGKSKIVSEKSVVIRETIFNVLYLCELSEMFDNKSKKSFVELWITNEKNDTSVIIMQGFCDDIFLT
jgi:hypothetical protein